MAYSWTNDLEIGNVQIDNEHKKLISAINDLMQACSKGKGRDELKKTVDFLLSYTRTHFSNEEVLQRSYKYPDYNNHRKYHQEFINSIVEIDKKLAKDGPTIALVGEVNSRLGNWFIKHIKTEDVKVSAHIKNNSR